MVYEQQPECESEPADENKLNPLERAEMDRCDGVIRQAERSFVELGKALRTVQVGRLYREEYRTFEQCCAERWDISRSYAYQKMAAAQVVENLSAVADIVPTNERQARPLTKLE